MCGASESVVGDAGLCLHLSLIDCGGSESVGNQHFWLLLGETHEFCHCGANTRARCRRPSGDDDDKGPKWKFVGDKNSLVTGCSAAAASETLRENASIAILIPCPSVHVLF